MEEVQKALTKAIAYLYEAISGLAEAGAQAPNISAVSSAAERLEQVLRDVRVQRTAEKALGIINPIKRIGP